MNYTANDWRLAVTNLLKKTSKGEVSWVKSELFKGDAWTCVDESFQCQVKDKYYVVSGTRTKYFLNEEDFVWSGGRFQCFCWLLRTSTVGIRSKRFEYYQ